MAARPFLTVAIRGQKDAVRIRHRARQIASLLHYPVHEQTCVAAATFVIACQALRLPGRHVIHFTIDNNQLHVDAGVIGESTFSPSPLVGEGGSRKPPQRPDGTRFGGADAPGQGIAQ